MDELLPGRETSGSRDQRRDQRKAVGEATRAAHRDKEDMRVSRVVAINWEDSCGGVVYLFAWCSCLWVACRCGYLCCAVQWLRWS
jgi:hypothetical protein